MKYVMKKNNQNGHCANKAAPSTVDHHERREETPMHCAILTVLSYGLLTLFGIFRDFLRRHKFEKNLMATEPFVTKAFVPLYASFESFFTRNIYRRVNDCFNRPVASVPAAQFELTDRISHDFGWTYELSGTKTKAINLGSYNYLGLAERSGYCTDFVEKSTRKYGVGMCSTRQEVGNTELHRDLENLLADFIGHEAAITFGMGFATNTLNLPTLVDKHSCIISDELNHASLILGGKLSRATVKIFKHNDMASLEAKLREAVIYGHSRTHRPFNKVLIVVEGVFSMEGSIVRLPEVIALKKKYNAYLYLDEAHSIGALGRTGRGAVDYFRCDPRDVDVLMGTLTKAFGASGGYMAGSTRLINYIRNRSHSTTYACSMAIPVVQQVIASLHVIMSNHGSKCGRQRIQSLAWNTHYFRTRLRQMDFIVYGHDDSPVVAMLTFMPAKTLAFGRKLLENGIGVVVVGFPATNILEARARFCLSSAHTKEMLDEVLKTISDIGDELRLKYSNMERPSDAELQTIINKRPVF